MKRIEFNLMFWGTFVISVLYHAFLSNETALLMCNLAVTVFWCYAVFERCKTIGWSGAWWIVMFLPFVNLLFALVIGTYEPRKEVA